MRLTLIILAVFISACSSTESTSKQQPALTSGDASTFADSAEIKQAAVATIATTQQQALKLSTQLFNLQSNGSTSDDSLQSIDWDPTHDAAQLSPTYGINQGLLMADNGAYFAVAGEKDNARYLALGSNPFRSYNSRNAQMDTFMLNSIAWLTALPAGQLSNVVIAHMDESYWFKDESGTRNWLTEQFGSDFTINDDNACDGALLASCLGNAQLLIISQVASNEDDIIRIRNTVLEANKKGVPVLYMHWDGGLTALGNELLTALNVNYVKDNYWDKSKVAAFDGSAIATELPAEITKVKTMLEYLESGNYSFNLADCEANCANFAAYQTEFKQGVDIARNWANGFDSNKQAIFDEPGRELQKYVILLADFYRQSIAYPMDKATTDQQAFLQAYFADHVVFNFRKINKAQASLGNFSRTDFSHITPQNKTINRFSKRNFRAAGVYALPGKSFTVKRTDNSEVRTHIFINTQRSGSTHEWDENKYNRPKFLQSQKIEVLSGETITLTNPYGGPVQIYFDTNDLPVSFEFKNIGLHPYWNDPSDNQAFEAALAAAQYDWAELSTPGFEVHSQLSKMQTSMNDSNWGNASELANATMRYVHNFPHVLAGFKGPSIDVVPEIHDFANQQGWTIETIDMVKHMNADQATCGYGCSGNPYDAYWNFSPIGHGDIHELGHGLEKGRFRFAGWEGHASTNPYSYYTKTQFYKDTGGEPSCQGLPFDELESTLAASLKEADPSAYMQAQNLTGWSQGVAMYIQMMMATQAQGKLQDGWHLLARLHMLEREFNRADNNDKDWLDKRDSLGFSQFDLATAKSLSNNDWLTIAISYVTQLDFTDFLTMWGLPASDAANTQVASFSFEKANKKFYNASGNNYCYGLDKTPLDIIDANDNGVFDGGEAL